jgi:hypothetical protein
VSAENNVIKVVGQGGLLDEESSMMLDVVTDAPVSVDQSSSADADDANGKKKKRLLKKAPDAPKRFKSAYICFVMENMERVKNEIPPETKVRKPRSFNSSMSGLSLKVRTMLLCHTG